MWLAALLTLGGVGLLEIGDSLDALRAGGVAAGDLWSIVQALGFGTSFYLIGRLISEDDDGAGADQVLPVTAVNVATVAALSALWAVCDGCGVGPLAASSSAGWLVDAGTRDAFALPGALRGDSGGGLLWTGLVTTALVRVGETKGLTRVPQSAASVIVATEPLWASAFGLLLLGEGLDPQCVVGGALVVAACVVSGLEPAAVRAALPFLPGGARSR